MTKFLTGLTAAAAIIAVATILATTAQAEDLPPCSKTLNDHCIQMGGETMQPSPGVKAKQQENVKAVGKKAGEVGHETVKAAKKAGTAISKKWHEMTGGSKAAPGAIPHGCSPATTPCE